MKCLKCLLSFFLFTFLSFIVNAQNPQLHIEGHIRSDSLAGNLNRVLVADPQGNISAEMADTMKLRVIQLIDDNGEVRLEMDANKGHFQMLDNDSIFHEIKVLSPPTVKKQISTTQSQLKSSDPTIIDAIKEQLLEDYDNAEPNEQMLLDILNNSEIIDLTVTGSSFDLRELEVFGEITTEQIHGSIHLKDANGNSFYIQFINEGFDGAFNNQYLQMDQMNFSILNGPPYVNISPFEKLSSITPEAIEYPTGGGFSGTTSGGEEVEYNFGMYKENLNEVILGIEANFQNLVGEEEIFMLNTKHLEVKKVETSGDTCVAGLTPEQIKLIKSGQIFEISLEGIKATNNLECLGLGFDPLLMKIENNGVFDINNGQPDNYNNILNDIGGFVENGAGTDFFYSDFFGLSKFEGFDFVGLAFQAINQLIQLQGDLDVLGSLSKQSGTFKIDHPLDPENKWLYHSFVESPDMMNIYNGNVVTDAVGNATVELPAYFEALNMEFRYQLTVIGQFAQVIVSEKVTGNQFSIKSDKPNVEVSWQVTGIRNDDYARDNRVIPEVDKIGYDKGKKVYDPNRVGPYPKELKLQYDKHFDRE